MATKNKKSHTGRVASEVGAGLMAVGAAVAAGYYFYGSKNAKKHRKLAAKWATDMKNEVVREIKRLKKVDPKAVVAVIDRVARTYKGVSSINAGDLKRAANELKQNWEKVSKEARSTARKSVSRAKSTVKKVAKKTRRR